MWIQLEEFPRYSISEEGEIRNDKTDKILTPTPNQYGVYQVGLVKDGVQHKRGLAHLVAETFLEEPLNRHFNTPINLNGDRRDCRADNLLWRPRWFAIKYRKQFDNKDKLLSLNVPIMDLDSGEIFTDSWDAVTKYGLLNIEVMLSVQNGTRVWPTYQEFDIYEE